MTALCGVGLRLRRPVGLGSGPHRVPLPCGFLDYLRERVLFVRQKRAVRWLRALQKRYSSPSTEEERNARCLVERLPSLTDDERSVLFCYCRLRNKSATACVLLCLRQHVHDVLKRIFFTNSGSGVIKPTFYKKWAWFGAVECSRGEPANINENGFR